MLTKASKYIIATEAQIDIKIQYIMVLTIQMTMLP